MRCIFLSLLLIFSMTSAFADVFTYEANVFPLQGGWIEEDRYCDPPEWLQDGELWHHTDRCQNPPGGNQQIFYSRSLSEYEGSDKFFVEFRVETNGPNTEIPFVAPATLSAASFGSTNYQLIISRDLVKFIRDNRLPIVWAEIQPGVPHSYRLELYGNQLYRLFIDGDVFDQGVPEGPYPSFSPFVVFGTRTRNDPNTTHWDYFRWGDIPLDGSGDFDTDGDIDLFDV